MKSMIIGGEKKTIHVEIKVKGIKKQAAMMQLVLYAMPLEGSMYKIF